MLKRCSINDFIKNSATLIASIWLRDLPETLHFITVGQGFVREGDIVQPVLIE